MTDFIAGDDGKWRVTQMHTISGKAIENTTHLHIEENPSNKLPSGIWTLRGFSSNIRYAEKTEKDKLASLQEGLGRPEATCAALIPIRKNEAWWALAQDERRAIFEKQSHHTETGLKYLPAIARKLYHCRDIGEPFDFLTWFEYAPEHTEFFEELLAALRRTEEWKYVDREVDIRMIRVQPKK
jgi:chlorite dismutase